MATATATVQTPLSTSGANIVDARGKPILLRGVNWFGIETETHVPHGLWSRDYKEMLAQIRSLGYNLIRLPYSVESLRAQDTSKINYDIGSNRELQGKTPLEVMDAVIAEAERQGIFILLDSHCLKIINSKIPNDKCIPELWYGDGYTEADWIDTWKMLAQRYKNQANIIGADLKNEPHGRASWGTNNITTDWRLAAERCGNAILSINPNWLIVVEGVEKNVPGQKLKHWWGGNLEGVRRFPVRLSRRNKLVYSPHEYGPGVVNQPWFSERSFPKNLLQRWEIGFNYIARKRIAPILIGEFGGRQTDTISREGIWQNKLVRFIAQNNLSFAYWSWNPNSGDTAGILLDDWQNVDLPKQQMLSQVLTGLAFAPTPPPQVGILQFPRWGGNSPPTSPPAFRTAPVTVGGTPVRREPLSPSVVPLPPTVTPTTSPQSSPTISAGTAPLQVTTDIHSDWQTGFCVSIKLRNPSTTTVNNWQLKFNMNQAAINNSWNASFTPTGAGRYVATPLEWGRVIEPNQVREIGFCANKLGGDYRPTQLEIRS
ncbi:MAG: cellulase family glycosylhydrolase [Nostocaceae cyanobacterium]|nr:cellulase family glycosylhydrolase [Nostocaceae cyanobacterium]